MQISANADSVTDISPISIFKHLHVVRTWSQTCSASASFPWEGGLCSGGSVMGCMAISWILLGSLRPASAARDIRSTCSKMEAEDSGSLGAPFKGGGPEVNRKLSVRRWIKLGKRRFKGDVWSTTNCCEDVSGVEITYIKDIFVLVFVEFFVATLSDNSADSDGWWE